METLTLYRPVGPKELELIKQSGFAAFPPRLFHQPIFYPVMNEGYAAQIAREFTDRVIVRPTPETVATLKGAQWSDRLPRLDYEQVVRFV